MFFFYAVFLAWFPMSSMLCVVGFGKGTLKDIKSNDSTLSQRLFFFMARCVKLAKPSRLNRISKCQNVPVKGNLMAEKLKSITKAYQA